MFDSIRFSDIPIKVVVMLEGFKIYGYIYGALLCGVRSVALNRNDMKSKEFSSKLIASVLLIFFFLKDRENNVSLCPSLSDLKSWLLGQ